MTQIYSLAADLVAIVVLGFVVYYPRHRRRELLVAFLGVNAGVVAVTLALINSDATIGLGLGLFGVLSIIRLRSLELGQHEVAYYFGALALGLLGGLGSLSLPLTVVLMCLIVGVIAFTDSPRLLSRDRQSLILLDGAFTDDAELVQALERTVTGSVRKYVVARVDLVNDTTLVDVRWTVPRGADPGLAASPSPSAAASRPVTEAVR
jgi:hypothetical protein